MYGLAERLPGRTADDVVDEVAEREAVIPGLRPRLPGQRLFSDQARDELLIGDLVRRQPRGEERHPGAVLQHLPNRDHVLAVLAEGRPELSDAIVVPDESAIDQDVDDGRADPLADREDREERVRTSGPRPGVDDQLTVQTGRDLQPAFAAAGDQIIEKILHRDHSVTGSLRA
ncbi:hypothetical protein GCM10029976_059650 [Kribbella albertanoniae]